MKFQKIQEYSLILNSDKIQLVFKSNQIGFSQYNYKELFFKSKQIGLKKITIKFLNYLL